MWYTHWFCDDEATNLSPFIHSRLWWCDEPSFTWDTQYAAKFAMGLAVCCYYRHTFGNYTNNLVSFRNYYSIRTFSSIPHLSSIHSVNWVICSTLVRKPQTSYHRYRSESSIWTRVNEVYMVSRGENHLWCYRILGILPLPCTTPFIELCSSARAGVALSIIPLYI